MADFDSYFKEEKAAPGQAPVTLAGPKSFDSYFAEEKPPTEGINELPEKRSGAVRKAVEVGFPMALTGGAGIVSRPMGIVGRYGLDAASGAAGEGILQALGISKQDPTMLAMATAFPPLGRALGATALGLPKVIPGYRDAARAGLTEHVRALPGAIIPHGDPKAAYAAIQGNMNTVLPNWPELSATVAKHITQAGNINLPALKKMLSSGPTTDLMLNIEQALQGVPAQVIKDTTKAKGTVFGKPIGAQTVTIPAHPPGMTFENAKANIEGLSQLIRSQKGTPEVGALKDLKRAMLTDLEHMSPPGLPPLPAGHTRVYRGEGPQNTKGGGWFTTDPAKAALYGDVKYMDIAPKDMSHFAQGHGGPDELFTTNPSVFAKNIQPLPNGPPLAQWNEARAAYRDQKTTMMLDDVIEQHISNREGVELVNPDGILKSLRTNKELKERLTPAQMDDLTLTLKDWANASGGTRSKLAAMLTGMVLGGGPAGALAGWGAAEITARMLMSEGARKLIGNIITNPAVHNIQRAGAIIAAGIRGAFDEPGTTAMPFETEITPGKVMGTLPRETRTEPKAMEPSAPVPHIPFTEEDIKAKVTRAAKESKLDPTLFHAVVSTESQYNPHAVSKAGAVGLTQLMPKTAASLGVDPTNVDENLRGGSRYLKDLLIKYDGNKAKALAAYNAGPGRVDKGGPSPQETQDYVAKVLLKAGGKDDKKRR